MKKNVFKKIKKDIHKKSKNIVKKTSKAAKKNPIAAVSVGGAVTTIAAAAIARTTLRTTKKSFSALAAKRAEKAAANTNVVPTTAPTTGETNSDSDASSNTSEDLSPPTFNEDKLKSEIQSVILGSFKLNDRPLIDDEIARLTIKLTKQYNCDHDIMPFIYKVQNNLVREINKMKKETTEPTIEKPVEETPVTIESTDEETDESTTDPEDTSWNPYTIEEANVLLDIARQQGIESMGKRFDQGKLGKAYDTLSAMVLQTMALSHDLIRVEWGTFYLYPKSWKGVENSEDCEGTEYVMFVGAGIGEFPHYICSEYDAKGKIKL